MSIFFKTIAVLALLFFLMSAAVQYNDPDPFLWIGAYSIAAAAALLFLKGKLPLVVPLGLALAYLVGGVISWPEAFEGVQRTMANNKNVEQGREALGLFISAVFMLVFCLGIFLSPDPANK